MADYLFKDSFQRYKVAASSDAALLANMRQRYTSAGGFAIDNTGGLGGNRRELFLQNGAVAKAIPHSSLWVGGARYRYQRPLGDSPLFEGYNNITQLALVQQNADGTLLLRAGTSNIIGVSDRSLFSNTRYFVEYRWELSGASPITLTAELRINGKVEISGAASTGVNKSSLLSNDATINYHQWDATTGGGSASCWITDVYLKNYTGYEGDMRNVPLYPASDGGTLTWTPNSGSTHFDRVNSHPVDITKWLETATPGNIDLWGFDSLPVFSGTIVAINISVLVQKNDEGTKSFKIVVGSTGTDAESDEFFVSGTNAEYYEFSLKTDPTTGLAWTQAGINALIAGVKCIS